MLTATIFYLGLAVWSYADATTHSVPSQPFELWCAVVYLLQLIAGASWWPPLIWWALFAIVAHCGWLGSADAWLIAVLASRFAFLPFLWLLLLACATGLFHALVTHQQQLPWLPHLAGATICIALGRALLG